MTVYAIERSGSPPGLLRLKSTRALTPVDFDAIASEIDEVPRQARKIGFVAARQAAVKTNVETRWNGRESKNTANPGDWIVTNMSANRELLRDGEGHVNTYVILNEKFPALYAHDSGTTDHGDIYRALSMVETLHFPGGFEIVAPWGEVQRAGAGYLLKNGADVYGNAQETFEATYEWIPAT